MDGFPTDILEKYKKELEIDTTIDELNVKEVQLKLPAIKHKWVARLIQAKVDLKKLQSMRWTATEQIKNQIKPPVELPDSNKTNAASKQSVIIRIDQQIAQQELVIEYLAKVETIMKNVTYDIKNIIDIMKMESM